MYQWLRPQIAIPVHGEMRHMTAHARLAKSLQVKQAIVPQNGQMFRLAPGKAELIDEVPSGQVHLDGRVLVSEGAGLAKARRGLGFAGIIAITLVLDGQGRERAPAAIVTEGIPEPVAAAIRATVEEHVARAGKRVDAGELAETVRRAARRKANEAWGKKPICRVNVVEV
jgi:ribonuclease J